MGPKNRCIIILTAASQKPLNDKLPLEVHLWLYLRGLHLEPMFLWPEFNGKIKATQPRPQGGKKKSSSSLKAISKQQIALYTSVQTTVSKYKCLQTTQSELQKPLRQ